MTILSKNHRPLRAALGALVSLILIPQLIGTAEASINIFGPCEDDVCVRTFPQSCADLVHEHDFSDCCALSPSQDGSECTLTAGPACVYETRFFPCVVEGFCLNVLCLANHVFAYSEDAYYGYSALPDTCPVPDFPIPPPSQSESVYHLSMRFSGALALSWGDHSDHPDSTTTAWDAATTEHLQTYFEHHPELGVRDVLAIPQVYPVITGDPTTNSVAVHFLQFLSWRSATGVSANATDANATSADINGTYIIEQAFNTEDGKQTYLELLVNSTSTFFERVTRVSNVEKFEIPCPPFIAKAAESVPLEKETFQEGEALVPEELGEEMLMGESSDAFSCGSVGSVLVWLALAVAHL
ncbi:expressed unknown protein [Seminavis robusta]|uniref:Uncharacterized protein n=1 Tax=Seminavis robusta TaxID=568900 RepID=A0A9N8DHE2_9STRA|nr:expressed unknown protein [Seminavis robusta]|eukprot:Sro67_g037760.1 n/a (355) ;mRNA; f:112864-113928